ncbi:MAG: YbaB/EbfC family nucleoid-associated protein [Cyclobacteriaceae bacterium]
MFDMMNMMSKMKELRERMQQADAALLDVRANGSSGGGMVTAVVNGKKQLLSVTIDPSLQDHQIIQGLVVKAVEQAQQEADAIAADLIKKATDGYLPNIPGIDLKSLFGR